MLTLEINSPQQLLADVLLQAQNNKLKHCAFISNHFHLDALLDKTGLNKDNIITERPEDFEKTLM